MTVFALLALNALVVTGLFHLVRRPIILLARAEAAVAREDFEAAAGHYRALLRIRPEDRAVRLQLARVLSWQRRYAESISLYRELLGDNRNAQQEKM